MIRAGVFIGVDQTGNLQKLADAAAGAKRMYDWALTQGVSAENAVLITDSNGKVTPDQIYDSIKRIIDGAGVDQLILYFAGHGVNINRSEQWLLSDAPVRTSAAVNVAGSVNLARYCGIQHVVLISDACRVAPEGIQAQNVLGVDVFPNDAASDRSKPVDQFFACLLGKTAAEIKDPAVAAANYSALYTGVLLDALRGGRPDILEGVDGPDDGSRYVRLRRLESYLEAEIPLRVRELNLQNTLNQNPDAIITSVDAWLARILPPPPQPPASRSGIGATRERTAGISPPAPTPAPPPPRTAPPQTRAVAPPKSVRAVARQLVHAAAIGDNKTLKAELESARAVPAPAAAELVRAVESIATPFGPDHFETQCGIKVRGAKIVDFIAPHVNGQILGQGELVRIDNLTSPGCSVLLRFDRAGAALIPAIQGFIAGLTFNEGELVDIAYEPSTNSWRWNMFNSRAMEIRALRAVASSASQHGRFRLDQPDSDQIAQQMQYAKGVDPTLSVYAAYAYNDLQYTDRIRQMSDYLRGDIGLTFFDLALLGRLILDKPIKPNDGIVPFVPLLSQGWALLNANRVRLHPALKGIESSVRDSLWSLFDDGGFKKLSAALLSGDVR